MSASNKKKLRREQEAAKLTEKQLTEQKEAKKLRVYTTAFVVVLAALLAVAIFVGVKQTITNTGLREKNTVAVTVGEHEISNAELNYFYIDYINNYYSQYGQYLSWMGLDTTLPLNEQIVDEETGTTWADDFISAAQENARSTYALVDAAKAAGFELPADEKENIELSLQNISAYATLYGYTDADAYLKAMYGNGANEDSYLEYNLNNALASAYYNEYADSLSYGDADYRAAEAENYNEYSSFSYNYYYLSSSKFEGDNAAAAAEEAAASLISEEITSVDAFDAAIAALEVNAGTGASTACDDYAYASVSSLYADWVTDSSRKAGDMTMVANTSTDEEGNETVSGYYVVFYNGSDDNTFFMPNVRHILVGFDHNHDESEEHAHDGTYTDEEKAAAKAEAEELLAQWNADGATEELFAEMANSSSDDGDGTTGGLYENIYPGQMVENFEAWCYDPARVPGDTGIVETEYGYHVMYFVGVSELTYRDYQIDSALRNDAMSTWYQGLLDATAITEGDTKYIRKDLILG